MRALERNKVRFYYSLYGGKTPVKDEDGNETGEYEVSYSEPIEMRANISAARGEISTRQFGDSINYDKVISISDLSCPIDEHTVLWVDETDITKPHDYLVVKVAKSLNNLSIAISKVNVRE
jgi:hypothetical protein